MNVLSLFDGSACTKVALDRLRIPVTKYYASEVDKYAIKVAMANHPNIAQLGDVQHVGIAFKEGDIDLLVGGSPCQGFSFAGKQLNFDDPRSKLFFEFVRLKDNLQPKYFLLENVKMKKESEDIITKYLGVEPIEINSSLFSAQSRRRLYWTNIPFDKQIQDKGIVLKDILEDLPFSEIPNYLNNKWCGRRRGDMVKSITDDKAHCLTASMWKGQIPTFVKKPIQVGEATNIKGFDVIKRVYSDKGKSPTLTTMQGGHREPKVAIEDELYRKLTPLECERLQTVPDNYTNHVSKTQRYKMLGNGWTVDVVAHIFGGINE